MTRFIDVVFDGPPAHKSGRFVEVENARGQSISLGEWILRGDGFWVLRINEEALDAQWKEPHAMQTLSDEGRELIRRFEGLNLSPYHDAVGYPTIGYGHLLSREKWVDLSQWPKITEEQADDLLKQDVHRFERAVSRLVRVPLSQGQFDALVSFSFNLGVEALQASTLRRVLNEGHYYQIPYELRRWVYAGGVKLYGLARRRNAEVIIGQPWAAP